MATIPKTFAYGILDENGDTWFLRKPDEFILLDAPFNLDLSLQHNQSVSSARWGCRRVLRALRNF